MDFFESDSCRVAFGVGRDEQTTRHSFLFVTVQPAWRRRPDVRPIIFHAAVLPVDRGRVPDVRRETGVVATGTGRCRGGSVRRNFDAKY